MNASKTLKRIAAGLVTLVYLFISNGCEPAPKMIGYGNNEYSQLEFEGNGIDGYPLAGGYREAWAGENFSMARVSFTSNYEDGFDLIPGLYCSGDSSMGQCDYPDSLFNYFESGRYTEISLGLNHGVAVHSFSSYSTPKFFMENPLETQNFHSQNTNYRYKNYQFATDIYQWGDDTYAQTTIPEALDTNFIFMIAAGGNHNVALIGDTTLIADSLVVINEGLVDTFFVMPLNPRIVSWGDNSFNQCNVPDRFNPISDSLFILDIDAGLNHTVVTYDSSGITKLSAWGDNSYGQLNVPEIEPLNTNSRLLDIKCGYNHNMAILYDQQINYSDELYNEEIIDTVFTTINMIDSADNYTETIFSPLNFYIWGDDTYGQYDVPQISGFLEGFDVGGHHNTVAVAGDWVFGTIITGDYGPYGGGQTYSLTLPFSSGREIISWGKNDFGQTEFPLKYYIAFISDYWDDGGAPGRVPNSEPVVISGGNHTLVLGERIYRSPSMDYNDLNQFNGALGDTVYQTLTLKNIGPDTLYLDTLFLSSDDLSNTHPFYMDYPEEEYILYGDSISFQVYSVFDSSHEMNESSTLTINTRGWYIESVGVSLASYFGPRVDLSGSSVLFYGNYDETLIRSVTVTNNGNATVYIDSMAIRDGGNFQIEPIGEENSIEPGESMDIYLSTTLFDLPRSYNEYLDLYITNFNTVTFSKYLVARRYLKVGDNVADPAYDAGSSWLRTCGLEGTINDGWGGYYLQLLGDFQSKVHYLDFGFSGSNFDENYLLNVNTLLNNFNNNSYFFGIVTVESDSFSFEPWSDYNENCNPIHEDYFPYNDNVGLSIIDIYNNYYFGDQFAPDVQSVVFNEFSEITYMDTFHLDSVTSAIEAAIDDCGIGCLGGEVIQLPEDTSYVILEEGLYYIDSLHVENTSGIDLDYTVVSESGGDLLSSALFDTEADSLVSDVGDFNSSASIALWFKPLTSGWSDNEDGYTTFIAPINSDSLETWQIILQNSNGPPRIGWKDGESEAYLSETPLYHLNDNWYHCVFVHDEVNQVFNMYINGIWEVTVPIEHNFILGNRLGINMSGSGTFKGFLTQTAFWSDALSSYEVLHLYNMGQKNDISMDTDEYTSSSDLFLYWKFNESNGSIVQDYSGNDFHASLVGDPFDRWHSFILPIDTPWLFIMTGDEGTVGGDENNVSLLRVDATNLLAGTYYGRLTLLPEESSLTNSQSFVKLIVTESLGLTSEVLPITYSLHQNYPNPFNPLTEIKYALPRDEYVQITIYNLMGKEVQSLIREDKVAGTHSIQWNATNNEGKQVSAGVYLYKIQAGDFSETKKMILLK